MRWEPQRVAIGENVTSVLLFKNDNFTSKKRQVTQAIPVKNFSVRKANIPNHLHHQSIGSQVKPTTCSDITGVINAAAA
jgi:hypothetical protein